MDKNSQLVKLVKEWVDQEYADGRVTVLTDEELLTCIQVNCSKLDITLE